MQKFFSLTFGISGAVFAILIYDKYGLTALDILAFLFNGACLFVVFMLSYWVGSFIYYAFNPKKARRRASDS